MAGLHGGIIRQPHALTCYEEDEREALLHLWKLAHVLAGDLEINRKERGRYEVSNVGYAMLVGALYEVDQAVHADNLLTQEPTGEEPT